MKLKTLIPIILLITTTSVMAGIFDKIEGFLDTKPFPWSKDLDISTVDISNFKFDNIVPPIASSLNLKGSGFSGRAYNKSSKATIGEIEFKFEVKEYYHTPGVYGNTSVVIGEANETIYVSIPPNQARYFDGSFSWKENSSTLKTPSYTHSLVGVRAAK
ncbi:MAG: hypothetical protein ABGY11_15700 [Candidatus Thioglobus sp.]|jgi:hypothetical protein